MDKLKRAICREINYYLKKPVFAHLEVTYKCNLSCKFCGFRKGLAREKMDELSVNEWVRIIDELKEIGVSYATLVGAEPLIRKDIFEIIAHIKKKGMRCLLLTNGVLIDPERAKRLVESGLDRVTVSIDGPKEIHDKIRGVSGVYEKATAGIRNLITARSEKRSALPKIAIHATVCSLNVEYLNEIADLYEELDIDDVNFQYITETSEKIVAKEVFNNVNIGSRQFIPQSNSYLLDEKGAQIMRDKINQILKRKICNFSIRTLRCLPAAPLTKGHFPIKKCYVINTDLHIDPYGNLHPCAMLKNYSLGNASKEGVRQAWNSKKADDLRVSLRKRLFNICKYCCHFNANLTFSQAARVYLNQEVK